MDFEVETHPEALEELDEALGWYGRESSRAPGRMLREYDEHIAAIRRTPDRFRLVYREYRRLNLDCFPYAIIYRIRRRTIFIIAVMHERSHPDYWKHRIDEDQE
jgi:plasmid stabilization system protein ParE